MPEGHDLQPHDGSDWMDGPASRQRSTAAHDAAVDNNGNVWMSTGSVDKYGPDWTVTRLNPQTGQVTAFKTLGPDGVTAMGTHGISRDQKGSIWFDIYDRVRSQTGRYASLTKLDPATETFEIFTPPPNMGNGTVISIDADAQGKIWTVTAFGAIRFDPDTKKFLHLQNVTPQSGLTYGIAGDADGNGWWTQFDADRVVKGDPRTAKSFEVVMDPPGARQLKELWTPTDREFYEAAGVQSWGGFATVPGGQGPRRLAADKKGDVVWVPNYTGNNLAKINIRTLKTMYYPLPVKGNPYEVTVDENHNVWVALMVDDWVLKFDPKVEQWTSYKMPSLGCEARDIAVDDLRGEVWVPCNRSGKLARLQFRTAQQVKALKTADEAATASRR